MPVARHNGFRYDLLPHLADVLEACDHYTYAIWDGEAIKVGKSCAHPVQRCADLQTGNPRTLRLVAYSAVLTEAQAHRRLNHWRIRGEWFRVCPEVVRAIATWCWVDVGALSELMHQLAGRRVP